MSSGQLLRVVSGPDTGRVFSITHFPCTVGVEDLCDLRLTAPDVAERHAVIDEADGVLLVHDLNSASGTFINGTPIQTEILNPGDTLAFGTTVVQYWVHGEAIERLEQRADTVPEGQTDPTQEIQASLSRDEVSSLFVAPTQKTALDDLNTTHRSLQAVYEINNVLGTTFDLETVLARVLDIVLATVDGDRGVVSLRGGGFMGEMLEVARRHPGRTKGQTPGPLRTSRTIVQHVLRTGEAVLTTDAASDDRFQAGDSVLSLNIHSAMCVPLRGRAEPLGVIHVDAGERNVFTEDSLRLLATIADIAGKVIENAQLYEENLDAERLAAVGETVAGTAHYMKNLLTGLMAGAELIDLGLETDDVETVVAGWTPIRKNLDILSDLVLNMLDFSRDRQPSYYSVRPADLVSDLCALVRHRADGNNIRLVEEVEPELPDLRADPVGIHRALLNLLTNAFDAIPKDSDGVVTVRASSDDSNIIFSVSDNGEGVPEEVLPQIFDIFCTTKGSRGTGFGLAVTKKIVEEHNGHIDVQTAVGEGTTFSMNLPR